MKKNMGAIDRLSRTLVALVILYLYFTDRISVALAIPTLIIAGLLLITSFVSFCPLYLPFRWSTRKPGTE